jgi:hypothetical protein
VLFDDSKDGKFSMATANTADLDGDGDQDLLLGDVSGSVHWAKNEGTPKAPKFTAREPLRLAGAPLKVCHKSDPIACDWDGDGRLDVLVGDETGDVSCFLGLSDGSFAAGVSLFSKLPVDPKDNYTKAKQKLEPHRVIPGYRLRLAAADWNDDGKLDLLVGNCVSGAPTASGKSGGTTGHVYVLLRQ